MSDTMVVPEKLTALLEAFDGVTDTEERMSMLASYAGKYREVPPAVAHRPFPEDARVPFCESEAFVWAIPGPGGPLTLHFAVENPSGISAKALATILVQTLSGARAEEIAAVDPDIVTRLFRQNISMGKGMGLMGIVQRVRDLARATLRGKSTP